MAQRFQRVLTENLLVEVFVYKVNGSLEIYYGNHLLVKEMLLKQSNSILEYAVFICPTLPGHRLEKLHNPFTYLI